MALPPLDAEADGAGVASHSGSSVPSVAGSAGGATGAGGCACAGCACGTAICCGCDEGCSSYTGVGCVCDSVSLPKGARAEESSSSPAIVAREPGSSGTKPCANRSRSRVSSVASCRSTSGFSDSGSGRPGAAVSAQGSIGVCQLASVLPDCSSQECVGVPCWPVSPVLLLQEDSCQNSNSLDGAGSAGCCSSATIVGSTGAGVEAVLFSRTSAPSDLSQSGPKENASSSLSVVSGATGKVSSGGVADFGESGPVPALGELASDAEMSAFMGFPLPVFDAEAGGADEAGGVDDA